MKWHGDHSASVAATVEHKPRVAWTFIVFVLVNAFVVFSPLSKGAIVVYPATAALLAFYVLEHSKPAYVGFVCWLWFFTPFVRRVEDWHAGGSSNIIQLAPYLAISVAVFSLAPKWSRVVARRTAPLFYFLATVGYGIAIGILHFSFSKLPQAVISWALPAIFALFLFAERDQYKGIYKAFEGAMVGCLLVSASYGIYQYFMLPLWDMQWMQQSGLNSIGSPEPMQVRIFSTMNSPQVFAAFCAGALLVALRSHLKIRYLAIPIGFIALVLTISRTAWIGFAAGLVYFFFATDTKHRIRIIAVASCCIILSLVAMQIPEVDTLFTSRFSSLSDPQHDSSYNARVQDFNTVVQTMIEDPFGRGLSSDDDGGGNGSQKTNAVAEQDSSITASLFSLGMLGSFIFALAIMLLGFDIFTAKNQTHLMIGARAVMLAIIVESPANDVVAGPVAFLFWCCAGLCLAELQVLSAAEQTVESGSAQPKMAASGALVH
jgi:hypothetical protein